MHISIIINPSIHQGRSYRSSYWTFNQADWSCSDIIILSRVHADVARAQYHYHNYTNRRAESKTSPAINPESCSCDESWWDPLILMTDCLPGSHEPPRPRLVDGTLRPLAYKLIGLRLTWRKRWNSRWEWFGNPIRFGAWIKDVSVGDGFICRSNLPCGFMLTDWKTVHNREGFLWESLDVTFSSYRLSNYNIEIKTSKIFYLAHLTNAANKISVQ